MTTLQFAKICASLALDKKAEDPVIIDLRKLEAPAEFFVICSAQSDPQLKALANHIEKTNKDENDRRPISVDGFPASKWVVVDYGDVVVHIFAHEKRAFYSLEHLWRDAKQISVKE